MCHSRLMVGARAVLVGMLLLSAACASDRPFASSADVALGVRVGGALGIYAETVFPTVVGRRVYLTGTVLNFNEQQDVLDRVTSVDGVTPVMEDLYLIEVGNEGGGDPSIE